MNKLPLRVNTSFYNLPQTAEVSQASISFGNVGLTSERMITVCDNNAESGSQLVTIDIQSNEIQRRPNKADAVLPHPTRNLNAVRAKSVENEGQTTIHIFNMDMKKRIVNATVPDQVKFWKWINIKTLAIVGAKSVYHLNIENLTGEAQTPEKIMDREGILTGAQAPVQIIDYNCCNNKAYAYLVGLSKKQSDDGTQRIGGTIQLTSLSLKKSQFIEAFSCCFGQIRVGDDHVESTLFAYTDKQGATGKIVISEITPGLDPSKKFKSTIELNYPDDNEMNFPIFMNYEETLGLIFIATKMGFLFVLEVTESALILRSKISETHFLCGTMMFESRGCLLLNKNGSIVSVEVDEQPFVQFVQNGAHIKNNLVVAQKISQRAALPGSQNLYINTFQKLFSSGQYDEAARFVSRSPDTILRNKETIEKFKVLPRIEGQPHPLLKYFQILLDNGRLNDIESTEICQLVLAQKKIAMVERWFEEGKLTLTEELIQNVKNNDINLSERMSLQYKSKGDAIIKQQEKLLGQKITNASADELIAQLRSHCLSDQVTALNFARALARSQKLSPFKICELFLQNNLFDLLGKFAFDYLPNTPDSASWQTMILEQNLKVAPSVADSLLQSGKWSQYNKATIAALCEQKGLYLRALENYQDIRDIKRIVLNHSHLLPPDYLKNFVLKQLSPDHVVSVLTEILRFSKNIKLVVEIAQAAQEKVSIIELCSVFESIGSYEGIVLLLNNDFEKLKDSNIINKYLEACLKCAQLQEVEKIIANLSAFYDEQKTLELLLGARLPDPRCLVLFCDKHHYIKEMIQYLWEHQLTSVIETYTLHLAPQNSGEVLGVLMDIGVEESYVIRLLSNIRGGATADKLIAGFEQRNRLRLLEKWLEDRVAEGNILPEVHDALAKLVIDFDKNPEKFLQEDRYYNPKIVGQYAELRDPHLAFLAYNRDPNQCDNEIMELTEKNSLLRLQAQFLVQRQSIELWNRALRANNIQRPDLVEQIVQSILPNSKNPEEVSTTVQAFIAADMPEELLFLLEKLVLHSGQFASFKKLQNLLLITAIRTDKSRVMDYLNRLDNYDGLEVVKHCLNPQYGLYEEAFEIYKKLDLPVDAVDVLILNIRDLERAWTYAEKINKSEVWTKVGSAYLQNGDAVNSMEAFIKAKDQSFAGKVIELAHQTNNDEKLLEYLQMCRSVKKEALTDNETIFTLARSNRLSELEAFIATPNTADLARVAENLYDDNKFEAAKYIFLKLKSNARIASCFVKLNQLGEAIEFAKKANNSKTWKEVAFACIDSREFKLAAVASASVALFPDHLEELVAFYELYDAQDEIIQVLEQSISNEKSHVGIFTELAVLLAKHFPHRLFDFLRTYFTKLNASKISRICKKYGLWQELVFLQTNQQEFDAAAQTMIDHSPSCFSHDSFVALIHKAANQDLVYKAIAFYSEENPLKLNELLRQLSLKMDISKTIGILKRNNLILLVTDWLKSVQPQNIQAVNDALNQIYLDSDDFESLRNSILQYDAIDAIILAKQIESSDQKEFRRLSSLIYRRNGKFKESIELSLAEGQYKDAIDTAKESGSTQLAEKLIENFAKNGNKVFFTLTTKVCYELLAPDVIMETAWLYQLNDFSMPFMIQYLRNINIHMSQVTKKQDEFEKKEEEKMKREVNAPMGLGIAGNANLNSLLSNGMPMLTGGFGSAPSTDSNMNNLLNNKNNGGFGKFMQNNI